MSPLEQLKENLESAIGGMNTGDIEQASMELEEFRHHETIETLKSAIREVLSHADGYSYSCPSENEPLDRDLIKRLESLVQ